MGNSFGFEAYKRYNVGIWGPLHAMGRGNERKKNQISQILRAIFLIGHADIFMVFIPCNYKNNVCLENLKCSSRAIYRCLTGRLLPADRKFIRPALQAICN